MKILTKHILKEFFKPFASSLFIFLTLFFLSESFRIINISQKPENALYFLPLYLIYQTPIWLTQILPISMLLGFLFSFGNLANFNEVTAIKAGGINLNRIFFPIILFALGVSFFTLFASETITPKSNKLANELYSVKIRGNENYKKDFFENINYLGKNNAKYIIQSFDAKTKTLHNLNIDIFEEKENVFLKEQIYAKNAVWVKGGTWKFQNGVRRTFDNGMSQIVKEEIFDEKIINLDEPPENFMIDEIETNLMTRRELKKTIVKLKKNSIPADREITEMYHKLAFPFVNLIVILIGIAFAASTIKTSKVISFAVSIVVSFTYWGITSVFISLGANKILPPLIAAWFTNFLFLSASIFLISKLKR